MSTGIVTAADVATLLHCSTRTVEDHARAGTIPGYRFGDGYVFSLDLVFDAVRDLSLKHAQARSMPIKPVAVSLGKGGKSRRKTPPGLAGLSAHSVSQVFSPQAGVP